jgi:thiol-disulfide isomerase/thioredoxin
MKQIIFIALILAFLCSCRGKNDIPVFNLLLPDSASVFNTSAITRGKVSIFVFFSPGCEHCQDETIDLIKNMSEVKEIQFYYVSIDSLFRIRDFRDFYELSKYPNIVIGRDYTYSFPRLSGLRSIPSSAIYDERGKLRVIVNGGFKVSDIVEKVKKL